MNIELISLLLALFHYCLFTFLHDLLNDLKLWSELIVWAFFLCSVLGVVIGWSVFEVNVCGKQIIIFLTYLGRFPGLCKSVLLGSSLALEQTPTPNSVLGHFQDAVYSIPFSFILLLIVVAGYLILN